MKNSRSYIILGKSRSGVIKGVKVERDRYDSVRAFVKAHPALKMRSVCAGNATAICVWNA